MCGRGGAVHPCFDDLQTRDQGVPHSRDPIRKPTGNRTGTGGACFVHLVWWNQSRRGGTSTWPHRRPHLWDWLVVGAAPGLAPPPPIPFFWKFVGYYLFFFRRRSETSARRSKRLEKRRWMTGATSNPKNYNTSRLHQCRDER